MSELSDSIKRIRKCYDSHEVEAAAVNQLVELVTEMRDSLNKHNAIPDVILQNQEWAKMNTEKRNALTKADALLEGLK